MIHFFPLLFHFSLSFNDKTVKEVFYLKKVVYNPEKIPFVPISGFEDEKMIERFTNFIIWCKGRRTLREAVDQVNEVKRPELLGLPV